jgi:ribosomal-protein-alanine N-acetyltransferase
MQKNHIDKMQISDLAEVMKIEKANYPVPWTHGVMKDCIKAGYQCIVLKQNKLIVGYAFLMVNFDESHLLNMCIDKSCQSQGLGRKLLSYLENICLYHQSHVFLLEVRKSNPIAYSLYLSFGFNEIGVRKNYYKTINGREDAIVMTKKLLLQDQ